MESMEFSLTDSAPGPVRLNPVILQVEVSPAFVEKSGGFTMSHVQN